MWIQKYSDGNENSTDYKNENGYITRAIDW